MKLRLPSGSRNASLGFTLVELLVVIAVIAIIASLLLPALSRAKRRGYTIACVGNLRQVGIALNLYSQQEGFFPLATVRDGLGAWQRALRPMVGETVLCCPQKGKATDKLLGKFPAHTYLNPPYGYNLAGSAWNNRPAINPGLGGDYFLDTDSFVPTPETRVLMPAQMIAFGDSPAVLPLLGTVPAGITPADLLWIGTPYTFPAYGGPGVGNSHNGGANMLFCDAHVEFARQSVWMDASDEHHRLWNSDHQPHD